MSARKRIDELLVQRATEGLDADEVQELARLLERTPDVDERLFDEAAALVSLAAFDPRTSLPESLARRLVMDADSLLGKR